LPRAPFGFTLLQVFWGVCYAIEIEPANTFGRNCDRRL
jgi:hypothetical protein